MAFNLMPGETVLYSIGDINVTTRRVVLSSGGLGTAVGMGNSIMQYVPLEKIDFVQEARTSKSRWLVIAAILGALGLIIGFGAGMNNLGPGGMVVLPVSLIPAAIFLGIWFLTRKQTFTIASPGGAIQVESRGLGVGVGELIQAVESARLACISQAYPPTPAPPAPPRVTLRE